MFAAVMQFALVAIVTRLASESVASAYFALTSFAVLVAALPTFGAGTGLIYFLARYRALGRWDLVARTLRVGLVPTGAAILGTGLAIVAFADTLAVVIGIDRVPGAVGGIQLTAVAICATAAVTLFTSATRGFGSNRVTVFNAQVLQPVLQLILVASTVTSGLVAMAVGWSLPIVVAAVSCGTATLVMFRRGRTRSSVRPSAPVDEERLRFWAYSSPLGIVLVLKSIVQRADVIVLSAVGAPLQVLLYVAASRYLVLGQLANRAMNWTLQPRISAALAAGDRVGANAAYGAATAWLVLASWPLSFGCILFSGSLLEIVGGHGFRAGGAILIVLAVSMLVAAACGNVEAVLAMTGRTRLNLAIAGLAVVTNLALLFLLIPRYGSLGAAYAWAVAIVVSNVVPTYLLQRLEGLTPFTRSLAVAAGLAIVSTLALGGIIRVVAGDSLQALGTAVVLCGITHTIGTWLMRRELSLVGVFGRGSKSGSR